MPYAGVLSSACACLQWLFTCPPIRFSAAFWNGTRFGTYTPLVIRLAEQWVIVIIIEVLVGTAPQAPRGVVWIALSARMLSLLIMCLARTALVIVLAWLTAKLHTSRVVPMPSTGPS